MIDKRASKYIKSIATNRSFSKASEELYIAQPSLSRFVKDLERDLGVELFNRNKIPIELTPAGVRFLEYIAMFEDLQKKMDNEFFQMSTKSSNKLKIGTLPYLGSYILQRIISDFKKEDKETIVHISEYNGKTIEEALIKGDIDLYITNLPPKLDEISYKIIKPDPLILVGIRTPKLESKYDLSNNTIENPTPINFSDFKDETFILLQSWQNMRIMAEKVFKYHKFKANKIIETSSVANSLNLVNAGQGFTFICESALHHATIAFPIVYFSLGEIENIASIIISYTEENENSIVHRFGKSAFNTFSPPSQ